jgi:hypothetical protein
MRQLAMMRNRLEPKNLRKMFLYLKISTVRETTSLYCVLLVMADEIRPAKEVKVPSLQSSVMIGHGPKRDVSKCVEDIRRDLTTVDANTGVHSHIKKDYYFYNRYPKTAEALFQSPGNCVRNRVIAVCELFFQVMWKKPPYQQGMKSSSVNIP